MTGQRPLDLKRAQHGLLCPGEGNEEGVSLRINLMTAMAGDRGADQAAVLGQDLRVAPSQRLDQPRRTLDIGEQEGDYPIGKLAHAAASAGPSCTPGTTIDPPVVSHLQA